MGIIGAINNSIERNRDYYIDIDDEIILNCNLWQDAESGNFQCSNGILTGKFSKYDTAELNGDSELSIDGGNFTYNVASPIISADQYKTKDYSIDSITGKFKDVKSKLWIYNTYLRENVLEKSLAVSRRFSGDDIAKLNEANQKWLNEEQAREGKSGAISSICNNHKIPNIAEAFGVECITVQDYMREMSIVL